MRIRTCLPKEGQVSQERRHQASRCGFPAAKIWAKAPSGLCGPAPRKPLWAEGHTSRLLPAGGGYSISLPTILRQHSQSGGLPFKALCPSRLGWCNPTPVQEDANLTSRKKPACGHLESLKRKGSILNDSKGGETRAIALAMISFTNES